MIDDKSEAQDLSRLRLDQSGEGSHRRHRPRLEVQRSPIGSEERSHISRSIRPRAREILQPGEGPGSDKIGACQTGTIDHPPPREIEAASLPMRPHHLGRRHPRL